MVRVRDKLLISIAETDIYQPQTLFINDIDISLQLWIGDKERYSDIYNNASRNVHKLKQVSQKAECRSQCLHPSKKKPAQPTDLCCGGQCLAQNKNKTKRTERNRSRRARTSQTTFDHFSVPSPSTNLTKQPHSPTFRPILKQEAPLSPGDSI